MIGTRNSRCLERAPSLKRDADKFTGMQRVRQSMMSVARGDQPVLWEAEGKRTAPWLRSGRTSERC